MGIKRFLLPVITALTMMLLFVVFKQSDMFSHVYRGTTNSNYHNATPNVFDGNHTCSTAIRLKHIRDTCARLGWNRDRFINVSYLFTEDRHRVIYCLNNKCASTTFKALLLNSIGVNAVKKLDYESLDALGIKQLSDYSHKDIQMRMQTYFKFLVVRHPFDRLFSAYNQKFAGQEKSNKSLSPKYDQLIQEHFGYISNRDSKGRAVLSLAQFLELVLTEPERFKDIHWQTYESKCHPCQIDYNHVVYMETMTDDLDPVLDHLTKPDGPRLQLMDRNVMRSNNAKVADLQDKFKDIDPDIMRGLLQRYGFDMEIFGYTWDSVSGAGCTKCDCH